MSKKQTLYTWKYEIAVNGSEIVCNRFLIFGRVIHVFAIKIDFRGDADNFNAIRALNLQCKKPVPCVEPAHFFVSFLIFPSEEFFPQRLVNTAFYSPTVGATCFLLSKSFSSFTFLSISEVIKRRITTNKHYYFLQY